MWTKESQLCKGCANDIYNFHYNHNYSFREKKTGDFAFVSTFVNNMM